MPLTFSNALNNKMNPQVLTPLKTAQKPTTNPLIPKPTTQSSNGAPLNLNKFNQSVSQGLVSKPVQAVAPVVATKKTTPTQTSTPQSTSTLTPQQQTNNAGIISQINSGVNPYMNTPQAPQVTPPQQSLVQAPVVEAPKQPTYGGIIQSLVNKAQPSEQYNNLMNQAAEQYKVAGDTNQVIQRSQSDALHNPNFSLDTGIGRAGQIQQNYGQIGANALTQAQGLTSLAGAANTQQSLQQSALGTAANLASPQQVGYSSQFLDPVTGQPINPQAGNDMQSAVDLQVQKLKSGATDPASARAALANYGQAGINALEQSLGSGFNPNVSSANQQSAAELTSQANQLQSTFNGVDANFELLLNTAKLGGLNDSNVPALNALQQNVARGLASSEAVINFKNTLSAVRAGYANILGGGTTTVDSQNRAQEAIPDNISIGALRSLGEQLKSEAKNRIAGINQQVKSLTSQSSQSGSGTVVQTKAGPINVNW